MTLTQQTPEKVSTVNMRSNKPSELAMANMVAEAWFDTFELERWNLCKASGLMTVFKGRKLTAYSLGYRPGSDPARRKLRATLLNTFTNLGVSVSCSGGLESAWLDKNGKEINLNYKPLEVAPMCYLWHPRSSAIELADYGGKRSLCFSVMWATELEPETKKESRIYLTDRPFTINEQ